MYPVTTEFDLLDWSDAVKLADPVAGVLLNPQVVVEGAASWSALTDLVVQAPYPKGAALVGNGGAWTAVVVEVFASSLRVRAAVSMPQVGDRVTDGTTVSIVQQVSSALQADPGGGSASLRLPVVFRDGGSLEWCQCPDSLPLHAEEGRVVLGILNDELTFLLSLGKDGVAYAHSVSGPFVLLEGTADLATAVEMVWRLTVDHDSRRARIYATPEGDLARVGHVQRREIPLPMAVVSGSDAAWVRVSGARIVLRTLRAASMALVANEPPVAVVDDLQVVRLGELVLLDGSRSYDPDGSVVAYRWRLLQVPDGAQARLTNPGTASARQIWPDGAELCLTARLPGQEGNDAICNILEAPGSGACMVSVSGLTVTIEIDPAVTKVQHVLDALAAAGSTVPFTAAFVGDPLRPAMAGVLSLSGGCDGTGVRTSFRPDRLGAYLVELVVSDGVAESEPVVATLDVVEASVDLGYVPDGNLIWSAVSDIWRRSRGAGPMATTFSALLQMVTDLLLQLWQYDAAKSPWTIGRRFLRRWVRVPTRILQEELEVVHRPTSSGAISTLPVAAGTDAQSSQLHWMYLSDVAAPAVGEPVLVWPSWSSPFMAKVVALQPLVHRGTGTVRLLDGQVVLDDPDGHLLTRGCAAGSTIQLLWSGSWYRVTVRRAYESRLVLAPSGIPFDPSTTQTVTYVVGGLIVIDTPLDLLEPIEQGPSDGYGDGSWFRRRGGRPFSSSISAGDQLRVTRRGETTWHAVLTVTTTALEVSPAVGNQVNAVWDVVRAHAEDPVQLRHVAVWRSSGAAPQVGDTALLGDGTELGLVVAVDGQDAAVLAENLPADPYAIARPYAVPVAPDAVRVPRLQDNPRDEDPLLYGRDYWLDEDGRIRFRDLVTGTLHWDGNTFTTSAGLGDYGVPVGATLYVPVGAGSNKAAGPARIDDIDGEEVTLTWLLEDLVDDSAPFDVPFLVSIYGAFNVPAESLWAEQVYYDASDLIDEHYGILVGLRAEDLGEGTSIDYLSAVQSLWFVLLSGPTLDNLRTGVYTFLGIPTAEKAGTIVLLEPDYSDNQGRIVIEAEDGEQLSYLYPATCAVATNPGTGLPYVVGDSIARYGAFCEGVEIHDRETDTDWIRRWLVGSDELKKSHTFLVQFDLDAVRVQDPIYLQRMREFIQRVKPADSDVIIVGIKVLNERIDVEDHLRRIVHMRLADEPYLHSHLGSWLPADSDGHVMRSGFQHRFDDRDADFRVPRSCFPTFSDRGRERLWLELREHLGACVPGEVLVASGGFGLLVEAVGASWILARYCPWTFDLSCSGPHGLNPGDEVWAGLRPSDLISYDPAVPAPCSGVFIPGLSRRWEGRALALLPGGGVRVALLPTSLLMPAAQRLQPDGTTAPGDVLSPGASEVLSSSVAAFQAVGPGTVLFGATSRANVLVQRVHRYPDAVMRFDRRHQVGPETVLRGQTRFPVSAAADGMYVLGLTGTADLHDILRDNVDPPTWFAHVLRSEAL